MNDPAGLRAAMADTRAALDDKLGAVRDRLWGRTASSQN